MFGARITVLDAPGSAGPAQPVRLRVRVRNASGAAWPATGPIGVGHVRLGVQLLDATGRLVNRDFHRADLPGDVTPGSDVVLAVACPAPDAPGTYALKLDLVAEGVSWFEPHGSGTASVPLVVR
jgi:hypothetical protein